MTRVRACWTRCLTVPYLQLVNPDNAGPKVNKDERNQLNVTNNLRIIPGTVGNVEIGVKYLFDTPVYWQLPKRFTGDKVRSSGRSRHDEWCPVRIFIEIIFYI